MSEDLPIIPVDLPGRYPAQVLLSISGIEGVLRLVT